MKKAILFIIVFFTIILLLPKFISFERTPFQKNWIFYKSQFIESGQVTEPLKHSASTSLSSSEKQGFALLFAVFSNDRKEFEKIWAWTQKNIQRTDHLFKQQYIPPQKAAGGHGGDIAIKANTALQNSSNGDIIIAWALLAAENKWDRQIYLVEGMRVLDAIKTKLIREKFGYQLILPSEKGFELLDGSIQVNLSYWIFPALNLFAEVTGDSIWGDVYKSGVSIMELARFSQWSLPSDWLIISAGSMTLQGAISAEYGENATRLPLYLLLAQDDQIQLITPFINFWKQEVVPARLNLLTEEVSELTINGGMKVIKTFTESKIANKTENKLPEVTEETDYYSATFILLSQLPLITQ